MSSSSNASNIALNRQALFQAECHVERNKTQAYLIRSVVEENHDSILKNYHAAFRGNRNLANANTDDLFRNRQMLIRCTKVDSDVQVNFREAKSNEAKIEFLEHRADLNARVLGTTEKQAGANAKLIEINSDIMTNNEEVVTFNSAQIAKNTDLIASGCGVDKATPESNAALIASNAQRIAAITAQAAENSAKSAGILASTEANRESISANAAAIQERRARMRANQDHIHENQDKIAALITAVQASASSASGQVAANKAAIAANRAELYNVEGVVLENKTRAYMARSVVEENHDSILKNYHAAFRGNRNLANANTDDLFRNRYAILRAMKIDAANQVHVNFREAKLNEAKIDYLEHRAALNARVLATAKKQAEVNAMFIEINSEIMANNEAIVAFNAAKIAEHVTLLAIPDCMAKYCAPASPEDNAKLIAANKARIDALSTRASANSDKAAEVVVVADKNRASIHKNSEGIQERRERMMENHAKILVNRAAIAKFVADM